MSGEDAGWEVESKPTAPHMAPAASLLFLLLYMYFNAYQKKL